MIESCVIKLTPMMIICIMSKSFLSNPIQRYVYSFGPSLLYILNQGFTKCFLKQTKKDMDTQLQIGACLSYTRLTNLTFFHR